MITAAFNSEEPSTKINPSPKIKSTSYSDTENVLANEERVE